MRMDAYKDLISKIEPDQGMEERLCAKLGESSRNHGKNRRWIKPAAIAAACAAVFLILFGLPGVLPSVQPARSAMQSVSPFGGLVVVAYAKGSDAGTDAPVELTPDVEIQLSAYTPAMSSVPGLPFKVDVRDAGSADSIEVSVDFGVILTWGTPANMVVSHGKTYTCAPGTTVYWSPLDEANTGGSRNAALTVTAFKEGVKLGSRIVDIKLRDEIHMIYTATLRGGE